MTGDVVLLWICSLFGMGLVALVGYVAGRYSERRRHVESTSLPMAMGVAVTHCGQQDVGIPMVCLCGRCRGIFAYQIWEVRGEAIVQCPECREVTRLAWGSAVRRGW